MSVAERIRRLFGRDRTVDTDARRIDSLTAARGTDHLQGGEYGGGIPPNYLPTGVDEGRPKK
ncbi:MAG TPA: hypothetical protein VFO03_10490 [Gaiellaceae bacterium]|nr:hypothetical protein [Gaiellaceae bacterium]